MYQMADAAALIKCGCSKDTTSCVYPYFRPLILYSYHLLVSKCIEHEITGQVKPIIRNRKIGRNKKKVSCCARREHVQIAASAFLGLTGQTLFNIFSGRNSCLKHMDTSWEFQILLRNFRDLARHSSNVNSLLDEDGSLNAATSHNTIRSARYSVGCRHVLIQYNLVGFLTERMIQILLMLVS